MIGMSSHERWFTPAKNVLLTGAGFTKNFGGCLASEMWSMILNQPEIRQSPKSLRPFLLEELNYEDAYDKVITSNNYTEEEKSAFTTAIRSAYKQMHEDICLDDMESKGGGCTLARAFHMRLAVQQKGFLFTLNQDLYFESYYYRGPEDRIEIPGLDHRNWFTGHFPAYGPTPVYEIPLGDESEVGRIKELFWQESRNNFAYVKLHGSLGWIGKDGADRMVIGNKKTVAIAQEPLLEWYFSLFKEVLTFQPCNLVVIGYGFRDWHINFVISHAIQEYKLRLHVVSPKQPKEFKDMLCLGGVPEGKQLWDGLFGYHTGVVTDFLQRDGQGLSSRGKALIDSLED